MRRWSILCALVLPTIASATEVNVNTSSGSAVVLIDEYVKGETPVTTDVDPGTVTLAFRNSMFGPVLFSKEVTIPESGSVTYTVDLDERTVEAEGGSATPAPDPEPTAEPEPADGETQAKIVSTPKGLPITLDGKDTGKKTPATLDLDPGKHIVALSDGCQSGEEEFNAREGVMTPVEVSLEGDGATVSLESNPSGASISVDGSDKGSTPKDIEMSCGEHTLVLSKEGYADLTKTIKAKGEMSLSLSLKKGDSADASTDAKTFGSLEVDVEPKDAVIKLDGSRVGTGKAELDEVAVGEHELTVERKGVELEKRTVTIKEGGATVLSLVVSDAKPAKPAKTKKAKGKGPSAGRVVLNTVVTAAGVPLVVLGTYNYGQARVAYADYEDKLDEFEDTGDDRLRRDADRIFNNEVGPRQTLAFAEWGAGGALLVTGTTLWITSLLNDSPGPIQVAPTGRGFVLSGKF